MVSETDEIYSCWEGEDHNDNRDEESHSGADMEQEGDDIDTAMFGNHGPAVTSPPLTTKDEM